MLAGLESLSLGELFKLHSGIGSELIRRDILRTGNNPCGDLAEALFCRTFNWHREANSKMGYDALTAGPEKQRIQIKARRVTIRNPSRQCSALRKLSEAPFDFLAGIVFDEEYRVLLAVKVPHSVVVEMARSSAHTNSARFFLRDSLKGHPRVTDLTGEMKRAAETMLRGMA